MYPEKLNIKPTKRSPWVVLDNERFFVMGRSIIENPSAFYKPVLSWISDYSKSWKGKTKIDLGFEYINTGSTKWLYLLLRELSGINGISENAIITWYYEEGDEDMRELGFILRSLVNCQFTIMEVNSMNDKVYEDLLSKSR
jgi:hypothetical protein